MLLIFGEYPVQVAGLVTNISTFPPVPYECIRTIASVKVVMLVVVVRE